MRKWFGGIVRYTESTRVDTMEELSMRGFTVKKDAKWVDYKNHHLEVEKRKKQYSRVDLSAQRFGSNDGEPINANNTFKMSKFKTTKVTKPNLFAENSLMSSII